MNKLLITIDFPPNIGGVARYLDGFRRQHNLDVLAPKKIMQDTLLKSESGTVFRKRLLWRGWPKWLPLLIWGAKYAKKYNKIVISHILPVGYLALFLKKPYTLIFHGLDIINASKSKWKRFWAKLVISKAEEIIVNSRATGELLRKSFGDFINYKVEYPMILKMAQPLRNFRQELGLENRKIILSLGRLVKRKGQKKIIKLMPRILQKEPMACFVIAGEGEYKKELEMLVKELGLENSVIFLGRVPDKNLPELYSMCDIFALTALPSRDNWEGFGMVCLEAAFFAKPVIVANVGGLSEAIENNITGFVVQDESELYIKIIQLLGDKNLRNELGDEGKHRVEEKFMI